MEASINVLKSFELGDMSIKNTYILKDTEVLLAERVRNDFVHAGGGCSFANA